jgi:hypothetical protein
MALEHPPEVDPSVRGIDEWVAHRLRRGRKRRSFRQVCLKLEVAFDPQLGRRLGERRDGDRIAERVVKPAQRRRRRAIQAGSNQAKVVAVARAQHQSMIAEPNRPAVTVDGAAPHLENAQMNRRPRVAAASASSPRPGRVPVRFPARRFAPSAGPAASCQCVAASRS